MGIKGRVAVLLLLLSFAGCGTLQNLGVIGLKNNIPDTPNWKPRVSVELCVAQMNSQSTISPITPNKPINPAPSGICDYCKGAKRVRMPDGNIAECPHCK